MPQRPPSRHSDGLVTRVAPPPFPTQPRGDLALPRVNQGIPASVGGRGSQTFEQEALEALATTIRAVIDEEAVVEKSAARMRHQACRPVL